MISAAVFFSLSQICLAQSEQFKQRVKESVQGDTLRIAKQEINDPCSLEIGNQIWAKQHAKHLLKDIYETNEPDTPKKSLATKINGRKVTVEELEYTIDVINSCFDELFNRHWK